MRRALLAALAVVVGCGATFPMAPTRVADRERPRSVPPVSASAPPAPSTTLQAPRFVHAPIRSIKLANGLPVVMLERHDLPIVALQIAVRRGRLDAQPYVLDVLVRDLAFGPGKYDRDSPMSFLNWLGVESHSTTRLEVSELGWTTLSSHTASVISTAGKLLRAPGFGTVEMERAIRRAADTLSLARAEPDHVALANARGLVGLGVPDDPAAVVKVTAAEVEQSFPRTIAPDSLVVAVVGDFDPDRVAKLLQSALGSLGGHADLPTRSGPQVGSTRLALVDRAKSRDATMAVELRTPRPVAPDAGAFQLACSALSARANMRTRIRSGYTYGVGVGCRILSGPMLDVTMSTSTARAPSALKDLLNAIASLSTEPLTIEELTAARMGVAVRLVGALETTEGASTFLADAVALGYPADVIDAVAAGVAQATPADVTAAARTYFSDPRASVVGDATVLAADLSSLGLGSAEVR